MAKVTFITFYNDFCVGINVLSSILIEAGHDVSVIFFKLPTKGQLKWFSKDAREFMEAVDAYGNILGGNAEINRWTNHEVNLLNDLIKTLSPDVICLNSRTTDNDLAVDVYPKVRAKTDAVLLAGGFGPSLHPELYADLVDYVFVGEAENCFEELISKIESGKSIKTVRNICYQENGTIIKNKLASPHTLKFKKQIITEKTFYIDNGNISPYEKRGEVIKTHTYSTFLGRGCISTCSYCSIGNWGKLYKREGYYIKKRRNRPVEDVIEELIEIKNTGITFIHFRDEFMTSSAVNLKRFFYLYEREINIPFWAYLVPKQIIDHPDLLEMAVDAGFVDTEIGFQSGSDQINRQIFTRFLPHKYTLEYTKLLSKYSINMQYDFIIFNPAESEEDVKKTFGLLQALPKERARLFLPRLFYFPMTPINNLLMEYRNKPIDFEYYYRVALLYLICFVTSEAEFHAILRDKKLVSSWQRLLSYYREYLDKHGIEFPIGTHEIPDSITTHRYQRILKKKKYSDAIVWGAGNYYHQLSHIFKNVNVLHLVDENLNGQKIDVVLASSPDVLGEISGKVPIFICSERKHQIKIFINQHYPHYQGAIYV